MSKEKKEVVYRGITVSAQYESQRALQELTVGQGYQVKSFWLRYVGVVNGKTKFECLLKRG